MKKSRWSRNGSPESNREMYLSNHVITNRSTDNKPSQCPACGYVAVESHMIEHYKVCARMKHKTEKVKADWTPPWAKK